jgi:hypothetical protein
MHDLAGALLAEMRGRISSAQPPAPTPAKMPPPPPQLANYAPLKGSGPDATPQPRLEVDVQGARRRGAGLDR